MRPGQHVYTCRLIDFQAHLFNNSTGILPDLVGNDDTKPTYFYLTLNTFHNSIGILPELIGNHETKPTFFYLQINRSSCPSIYKYMGTLSDFVADIETRPTCLYLQMTGFS